VMLTKDVPFHRMRSKEWYANLGFTRRFGNNRIAVTGYYQEVQNKNDTDRYVAKVYHFVNPEVYALNRYAGLQLAYTFSSLNDTITPVKGVFFQTSGTLSNNFYLKEFFQRYEARVCAFLPLTDHISFALRAGGATVVNDAVLDNAQLYQHAVIGGGRSLRGYRRERFWGQTAYYNQNELRFITDFHSKIMNGKFGVFGFFDNGRVWVPGENSNKIHVGYGPGILLSPFNKITGTITYSMSKEANLIQVRIDSKF
jgi:hemolysin activation/secretion protein